MAARKNAKTSAGRRPAAKPGTRSKTRPPARPKAAARKAAARTASRKRASTPTKKKTPTARSKARKPARTAVGAKKAATKRPKRQTTAQARPAASRATTRPKARTAAKTSARKVARTSTRKTAKAPARKAAKTPAPKAARKAPARRPRPRPATAPTAAPDVAIPSELAAPGSPLGEARTRQSRPAAGLSRQRRQLPAAERGNAEETETFDDSRLLSSARSGRREMNQHLREHTESNPDLTAGDIDARWEDAYAVGDEAPGGDNPTPDQDRVEDIGKALGVNYQDNEELEGAEKIEERDRHRWELDPASSDDWPHNQD